MNKSEFIRAISDKVGFTIKDTAAFHDAFWAVVEDALKAGEKIQIAGIGSAELKKVDAKLALTQEQKQKLKFQQAKNQL